MERGKDSKQKKVVEKCAIVALIVGIITEIMCSKAIHIFTKFSFSRALIISGIIWFIVLHFTINIKKLYGYIIDRRFSLSIIMILITTFLELFQTSNSVFEFLFSRSVEHGLIWNIRFYLMILITYELFMVITKNSKYVSFIGAIVVTFSGHVQYMFNYMDAIILGEFGVVCLKKYIDNVILAHSNPSKQVYGQRKIVWMILMIIDGIIYSLMFESFVVAYGYVFLSLIIWQLVANYKELMEIGEFKKLVLIQVAIIAVIYIINMFIYSRIDGLIMYDRGVFGTFDYLYTILLPFKNIENKYLIASMVSLFPIPLFMALYCLYKDDKGVDFLMPVAVICVLEAIVYMSSNEGAMATIKSLTLFTNVNRNVLLNAINYTNILLIFYFITNFEEKFFSFRWTIRITILSSIVAFLMLRRPEEISSNIYLTILSIEFCLLLFTFLNFDDKRYKGLFLATLIGITVFSGSFIHPIIKDKDYVLSEEELRKINGETEESDYDVLYEDGLISGVDEQTNEENVVEEAEQ